MTRDRRQQGFTLLELLVVLAIIAIVSTMSVGTFRFFSNDSPEKFQEQVASLLKLGTDEAILTGKIHGLFRKDKTLYLGTYIRTGDTSSTAEDQTKDANIRKQLGVVFSGLLSIGGSQSSASSGQGSVPAGDLGAFTRDDTASWVELDIDPLIIPDDIELTLTVDAGQAIDFAFDKEETLNTAELLDQSDEDTEEKPEDEGSLITIFWPSGLIQPGGHALIRHGETQLEVHWQTTAQISFNAGGA